MGLCQSTPHEEIISWYELGMVENTEHDHPANCVYLSVVVEQTW